MRLSFLLLSAALPLLSGCSSLLPLLRPEPIAFGVVADPAVRHGKLENGLSYFIRANGEPQGRAELRLAVNAGSILEDADQRGLAHFVEHMAFNGTRSFERQEIVNYLESIGMRFGPDVNAYTSFDETVYTLTLPTDSAEVLETGLKILEEWASAITFDSLQVEQERGVVIEEWRMGQGAQTRLQYQQLPTLAQRSRYAERLPIGTYESLERFDHAALKRFYDDWYRPDLMAVVAVGDFDVDEMEEMIRERFSRLPVKPDARERRVYDVPLHRETLISIASDPELVSSSVSVYMKRRPERWSSTRTYRNWVSESLASAMLVNRLNEKTQRANSPFLDVSSFQGRFVRTLSTFAVTARAPDDQVERALQTLLMEVERASRYGFTGSELEREKREMVRVMEQRYAERHRITSPSFAADYVSYFLYGGSVLDGEQEYRAYLAAIESIGLKHVHEAVRSWTRTANRVLLVSTPEREGLDPPNQALIEQIAKLVSEQNVQPYFDSISAAPLVRNLPEEGEIRSEQHLEGIDAYVWELGNGSTVVLKPTDYREDEVLFAGRSPGGTSLIADEDYIPALTAGAVVQAGGLGELSSNDLRKRLAGLVAGVGADIGEQYEGISGAASPRDLETLFQLVYLKFTAAREDSVAFRAYQAQARASLANRSASPDVAFQDSLRSILTQGHMRARPPSAAMFDQLDMRRSFEIYRERFADASDFTFFLVGNFDVEEVRPLVRQYLASLPSLNRQESGRDLGVRAPAGVVQRVVRKGVEPRGLTQLVFNGAIDFSRDNVASLQSLAEVLRIRLRETLREDMGGTYGVEVRGSAARDPIQRYQFSIGFGADPARIEELVGAVLVEINRLKTEGPNEADLAKVREMQFRTRETDLRDNHYWVNQLLTHWQYDWDLNEIASTAQRESTSLGPDRVREAANLYLNTDNYVQVTLLPEGFQARGPVAEMELTN